MVEVGQIEELVAGAKKGDPQAAGTLVERFWDMLCRYAVRLGASPGEAEDLAQDVFLRAFRSLDSFTSGTNFRAWLLRIATNRLTDNARRRASSRALAKLVRPATSAAGPEPRASAGGNPGREAERRELEEAVNDGLRALPEAERAVLVLRVYEGLPHREIARVVGKSEPTVRWHLHRARKRLRELLSGFL